MELAWLKPGNVCPSNPYFLGLRRSIIKYGILGKVAECWKLCLLIFIPDPTVNYDVAKSELTEEKPEIWFLNLRRFGLSQETSEPRKCLPFQYHAFSGFAGIYYQVWDFTRSC